jgi:hypothetical protein
MSCTNNTSNINKTFIIESPVSGDTYVISGSFSGDTLSLLRNDLVNVVITGVTTATDGNDFTTGTTIDLNNNIIYFDRTDALSAYTVDMAPFVFSGGSGNCINDIYITNLNACFTAITLYNHIIPDTDNTIDLGSPIRRFRDINTVSGASTVWTATTHVYTPELRLGLDSSGNTRNITADNSIIQDDCLNGGTY